MTLIVFALLALGGGHARGLAAYGVGIALAQLPPTTLTVTIPDK